MSFWGIEVKPGKPVKHSYDKVQRRLRISQATLGIGTATKTSFVQCNVGNKHPVFLCALLPDKTESCHLDLEFEEPDDVVFSVLGPRSVYLTGYYVNNHSKANFGSDTESYGEDIAGTESEKSGVQTDDDEYDDSFIDDDDDLGASPASNSRDDEKLKHSKKKTKEKNDTHNAQRRKFVVVDSDDDAYSQDSSDEDNYLLSVFKNKKAAKASTSDGENVEPVCQKTVEADDNKPDSAIKESESGSVKKKKLKRKRKEESDELKSPGDKDVKAQQADAGVDGLLSQPNKKPTSNGNIDGHDILMHPAEASSGNKSKPKKRTKVRDVEHIPNDIDDGASGRNVIAYPDHEIEKVSKITEDPQIVEDKKETAERDANPDLVDDGGNLQKPKKKKKKGKSHENNETLNMGGTPLADNAIREPSKASDVKECQITSSSQVRTLSNGLVVEEDLSFGDKEGKVGDVEHIPNDTDDGASRQNVIVHADHEIEKVGKITEDLQIMEDKKEAAERDANPDLVDDGGNLQIPKKKKKKGKSHAKAETLNSGGTPVADNAIREPSKASDVKDCQSTSSSQVRTLSNGLVVEDLSFGDKEGKVAALGKKVKIFYSAMLKENEQVLESNFGKTPHRFRLGDEGIIEGWNVGLEGMRVGDKRRLTVPPAMGYGSQGTGENIPPNSWLVYDVELVSVR